MTFLISYQFHNYTTHPHQRRKLGLEYDFTTFPAIKVFTDVGVGLVFSYGKTNIVGYRNTLDALWIKELIQRIINVGR